MTETKQVVDIYDNSFWLTEVIVQVVDSLIICRIGYVFMTVYSSNDKKTR